MISDAEKSDAEKIEPGTVPAKNISLGKRVASGLVLGPLTLALILVGRWTFMALMVLALGISLYEWNRLARVLPWPFRAMVAGSLYLAVCFAAYIYLRFGFVQGGWLALSAILAVWASDIGAYFTGKSIGGPKLAPRISPNKTWAGAGGAVFFSGLMLVVMFWSGHYWERWLPTDIGLASGDLWKVFIIGCALGAVGQAGDLLISFFKRQARMKDTGMLIPGHGGLLDRIDSLLLVSPVFLFLMMLWLA